MGKYRVTQEDPLDRPPSYEELKNLPSQNKELLSPPPPYEEETPVESETIDRGNQTNHDDPPSTTHPSNHTTCFKNNAACTIS
jgi:hypothetical protein